MLVGLLVVSSRYGEMLSISSLEIGVWVKVGGGVGEH